MEIASEASRLGYERERGSSKHRGNLRNYGCMFSLWVVLSRGFFTGRTHFSGCEFLTHECCTFRSVCAGWLLAPGIPSGPGLGSRSILVLFNQKRLTVSGDDFCLCSKFERHIQRSCPMAITDCEKK